MKKLFLIALASLSLSNSFANPGDTIVVQTFTFGSPQDAWFIFPSDTIQFEKILMQYTLKCNPAQSPACGEWDYLTYTYLYKNTGLQDSTLINQPIFTANGIVSDSIAYMNSPSWTYSPAWQYSISHIDTTSLNTSTVGSTLNTLDYPFGSSSPVSRSQFLWRASEMLSAGMTAGNITGLNFYIVSSGSSLRNLRIAIKNTAADSLLTESFQSGGFSESYLQNKTFSSTGWNNLQLTNAFYWDGVSNIIIDISYDNTLTGINSTVGGSPTSFSSGLINAGSDRSFSFHTSGDINVPVNPALAALDSFITVSYWAYGTPAYQPQDGTCFEAVDSSNNRLLNVHMPWGDNNVYWDAGFGGTSYDRINKVAIISETEGQWNFWTFSKNVASGSMKIYLNGNLWHSGTGKVKRMKGMKSFRIGKGNWGGSQTYEGQLDEFAVFNKELSLSEIQWLMLNKINISDPLYSNLALYFHADDGNYLTAADSASGSHDDATLISVGNPLKGPGELLFGYAETSIRPAVIFEQGVFTSSIDTTMVIDSMMNSPVQVITYTDSLSNPGMPVDTMIVWPAFYNSYVYDPDGLAIDSIYVNPDSVIQQVFYQWYSKFPQVIRYELARYITPYGNNLSLGSGWTWTFDLSDYRTLLADSVHLSAGNWQELLDVQFLMIEGTPPRDVISIQNLWNGQFNYGQSGDPIESHLVPLSVTVPAGATTSRWKSRITGHGMDTPENCAEFCPKYHYFKVDGLQRFDKLVWRDNCDRNPLYPQGGTWVYDRSNWCPGAEVATYDFELTPYASPGTAVVLDHDAQPYASTGGWDFYQIEDQLVSYGPPNFTVDVAVEDILSPSTTQMWLRYNPVCSNPVIRIKNTGGNVLTSATITYGLTGGIPSVFNWTGNLKFTETAEVTLGTFEWLQGASTFYVTVSNPNGLADQYANNNTKVSQFVYPPVMPAQFIIEFKSNNYFWENAYTVKDDAGNIVLSRNASSANTTYRDTLSLPDGCYTFELIDSGEDGLSFWANTAQGSGFVRFRKVSPFTNLKTFIGDFGGQVYQQFTVGLTSSMNEFILNSQSTMNAYPNPSDGNIIVDIDLAEKQNAIIEITDVLGRVVYKNHMNNMISESLEIGLAGFGKGMYFINLRTGKELLSKKIQIQ